MEVCHEGCMSMSDVYPRKVRTRPWHNLPQFTHMIYASIIYAYFYNIVMLHDTTIHKTTICINNAWIWSRSFGLQRKGMKSIKIQAAELHALFFFGPMPIALVACFLAVVEIVSCPYRSIKLIGCASRQPATWLRLGYRMCECEVAYNRESDGWNMVNLCEAL